MLLIVTIFQSKHKHLRLHQTKSFSHACPFIINKKFLKKPIDSVYLLTVWSQNTFAITSLIGQPIKNVTVISVNSIAYLFYSFSHLKKKVVDIVHKAILLPRPIFGDTCSIKPAKDRFICYSLTSKKRNFCIEY